MFFQTEVGALLRGARCFERVALCPPASGRVDPNSVKPFASVRKSRSSLFCVRSCYCRWRASVPPPLSKPNPSRLGFFTSVLSPHCAGILPILRVPQAISRRPESAHRPAKFDSFLVSVLKKSARTSPAEHTQKPSCDKQLPLMRRIGFDAWTTYCNSRTR